VAICLNSVFDRLLLYLASSRQSGMFLLLFGGSVRKAAKHVKSNQGWEQVQQLDDNCCFEDFVFCLFATAKHS